MNITLLNIKSDRKDCINKDFMGGYGWAFNAGHSIPAKFINFLKKRGERLPIMAFGYLAAIFHNNGHKVGIQTNVVPKADLVIMASSMVDYDFEIEWAKKIKRNGIRLGFIGPFSASLPELFLDSCDFIIKGEPEQVAIEISRGAMPKGLVESKAIEDLDSLPFPKWDIFPIKSYSYLPVLKEKPFLPILASRGCLFGCSYCPYLVAYKYRSRSPRNVLEEVKYLKDKFKVRGMIFRDPLFSAKKEFALSISELFLSEKLNLKWVCETRLDLLDKKTLELMYKAGLRVINTGIESADSNILQEAGKKPVEIQHQEDIIRYAEELGIKITAFYMLGLPTDSSESINRTIEYAKSLNTNVAQFFIHTPFPGTAYFDKVKSNIIENDWRNFDCYTPVLKHKNLTKEQLLKLKDKAFTSYYFRPSYIAKFIKSACRGQPTKRKF